MIIKDELEYVQSDIMNLSESDIVDFHSICVLVTPHLENHKMTLEYYFKVTIHDYYDSETDNHITLEDVTVKYWGKYDIDLVELLTTNEEAKLKNIYDCEVSIGYANYELPYDAKLSKELERNLQSTWEAIYCAMYDL